MEGPLGVRSQYGDQVSVWGPGPERGQGLGTKARAREGGRGGPRAQGPGPKAAWGPWPCTDPQKFVSVLN